MALYPNKNITTNPKTAKDAKAEVENVNYSKQIDLRSVMETLQVKVYATGNYGKRTLDKNVFITMDYDVSRPVQLYLKYKGKNLIEGFLYFRKEDFKLGEFKLSNTPFISDFVLRLNKENNRTLSIKQVGNTKQKSLLTTKEIFSTTKTPALNRLNRVLIKDITHELEMVLPGVKNLKGANPIGLNSMAKAKPEITKLIDKLGFDIDLRAFSTTGPITQLFLKIPKVKKNNLVRKYKKDKTGEIETVTLVEPRRIRTLTKAPTSYINMDTKDLEIGQVKFSYIDYFNGLSQDHRDYYISSSEVFIIKNDENYKFNMGDFLVDSTKELPYNVSRRVIDNEITESSPYFEGGLKKYPLSWASELRNNKFFSDLDRCVELKFYSEEHLDNFEQALKENQIANREDYEKENKDGSIGTKIRTYNNINEWVKRTDSDFFNDLRIKNRPNGRLESLTVCPSKETVVNGYLEKIKHGDKKCKCKYTNNTSEKLIDVIVSYVDGDCAKACREEQKLRNLAKCWTCEKKYSSPILDLRNDYFGTTYSTFRESFSAGTQYTGYTSGGITGNNSYDVYFSGGGYTATTFPDTGIAIPITNINRIEHRPFVGVSSPNWVPFYSWQSLSGQTGTSSGSGAVIIQSGDPKNYLMYKCLSGGTYKFQYNAYLDVKYKDTKWCEYISSNYLSGSTSTIGYPNTEYELKRLINSSIIEHGLTEGATVLADTNGVYFPGIYGINPTTGINEFKFDVFLEKQDNSGNTSNLLNVSVGASPLTNPTSNLFLLNQTNIIQNSMSGFSNCYASASTANTVFNTRVPILLNTGLITLLSGDTVMLKYNTTLSATSKVSGGKADIMLNLGHKLDLSGNPIESPFYRVTKYSPNTGATTNLQKKLFTNPQKLSKGEKYINVEGKLETKSSSGALYIIDNDYSPITPPKVNSQSFGGLTFIDNPKDSDKLLLNVNSTKPTNNWKTQLEANQLTDYYLPNNTDLIEWKSGVQVFNLPRYDQQDSITCNYKFPQLSHSYVIKNTISNVKGINTEHFVVVTPEENLYTPCFTPTLDNKVELVESEIRIKEQIDNVDEEILIDNKPIILKSSRAAPITQFKADDGFRCKFYCVCEDTRGSDLLDPFYGTSKIITDTTIVDCDDCEEKAMLYCGEINNTCKPKVFSKTCNGDKDNLYTSGDEFKKETGDEYVGFYHTYNGLPMEGYKHTTTPHDTLIPMDGQVGKDNLNKNTSTGTVTITQNTNTGGGSSSGGGSGGGGY